MYGIFDLPTSTYYLIFMVNVDTVHTSFMDPMGSVFSILAAGRKSENISIQNCYAALGDTLRPMASQFPEAV